MAVVIAAGDPGSGARSATSSTPRSAGATPPGHVSALNLKLKLLKKRGHAPELPVIDEPRSYATTPGTNLS
jgi:hypothetical protein